MISFVMIIRSLIVLTKCVFNRVLVLYCRELAANSLKMMDTFPYTTVPPRKFS